MTANTFRLNGMTLLLFAALAISGCQNQPARVVTLIDENQADELRYSAGEFAEKQEAAQFSTRGGPTETAGPIIVIHVPTAEASRMNVKPPAELWVEFQENRAPVDIDSLRVEFTKEVGFFSISRDVTEKLRTYLNGPELRIESFEIPSGNYEIQFVIADKAGNQTAGQYFLTVE